MSKPSKGLDTVPANKPDEQEPLTEELLQRLLASSTPEAYLEQAPTDNRTLADYLFDLIDAKGITRADVQRGSAVNSTFVYQIFKGDRKVTRDNAIRLAFGTQCTLREAQRLLRHAGVSELWCKNRRDAIIIHCIEHGYNLPACDDELYRLGEPTLVPREG
ncbi:MAG: XRE family transcriptional regulator [Atopobiaceae bacterium]|nr:XRE family transcriptional regulator [Atopobiaceae bacterium]MDO4404410.1 XRE family transcriptional regulator [Atopobiaceae bacterium]